MDNYFNDLLNDKRQLEEDIINYKALMIINPDYYIGKKDLPNSVTRLEKSLVKINACIDRYKADPSLLGMS